MLEDLVLSTQPTKLFLILGGKAFTLSGVDLLLLYPVTYPARRWVVERTLGWLSKCRALLVRYEKKAANYLGLIKVACILIWYRRQHRLSLSR